MKSTAMLILTVIVVVLASASTSAAKTIEVGGGQEYSTIAAGVNAASSGDVVNIHSGTYSIDSSIVAKSGVIIQGAGNNQTVIYTDSFSDVSSESNPAMIYVHGVKGVTITGIKFVGPATSRQHQHSNGGTTSIGGLREARNGVKIQGASDVKISNCYFTLLLSDGVRIADGKDVSISGCKFECAGHDSISEYKSSGIKVSDCTFDQMINTCIRLYNVEDCSVVKSTFIQNQAGTGAGYLEFEGSVRDVAINHNVFLKSTDPVMFRVGASCSGVVVNDNILYQCSGISGGSGITTSNNNVASSVSNWAAQGYGYNSAGQKMVSLEEAKSSDSDNDEEKDEEETNESVVVDIESDCSDCSSCDEEVVPENCTPCDNCTTCDNTTTNTTVADFITVLTSQYLDFSADQAESSAVIANSSAEDMKKASVLMNNTTTEEQVLGQKYIQASELKLQLAKDLLNLSQENLNSLKTQTNNTSCINNEC